MLLPFSYMPSSAFAFGRMDNWGFLALLPCFVLFCFVFVFVLSSFCTPYGVRVMICLFVTNAYSLLRLSIYVLRTLLSLFAGRSTEYFGRNALVSTSSGVVGELGALPPHPHYFS